MSIEFEIGFCMYSFKTLSMCLSFAEPFIDSFLIARPTAKEFGGATREVFLEATEESVLLPGGPSEVLPLDSSNVLLRDAGSSRTADKGVFFGPFTTCSITEEVFDLLLERGGVGGTIDLGVFGVEAFVGVMRGEVESEVTCVIGVTLSMVSILEI